MAEEKYTCNRCGKSFEKKPGAQDAVCPECGSPDSREASDASGCGKSARFS